MLLPNRAPSPRFRLYTSPSLYGRLIGDILTGQFGQGADDVVRLERGDAST